MWEGVGVRVCVRNEVAVRTEIGVGKSGTITGFTGGRVDLSKRAGCALVGRRTGVSTCLRYRQIGVPGTSADHPHYQNEPQHAV